MHISAASHKNRKQRSNPYFPAAHPTGSRATTMPMPESASSELMTLAGSAGFDARKMRLRHWPASEQNPIALPVEM